VADIDPEGKELDTSWLEMNKVTGKQAKASNAFLGNKDQRATAIAFAIADEAYRYLSHQHLHYAYQPKKYDAAGASPLQTMANDRRRPIYAALSYLSSLYAGKLSRLIMLWRFRECASLEEWYHRYPQDSVMIRRSAVSAAGGIQRRERSQLKQFELLTIGDPSMPVPEQLSLIAEFVGKTLRQHGSTLAGRLWLHYQKWFRSTCLNQSARTRLSS